MAEVTTLTLTQVIQHLDQTLGQLNASLQQLDQRTALQIELLRRDIGRLEEKVEARARQSSLDELQSDVKAIKVDIGSILDRMTTRTS